MRKFHGTVVSNAMEKTLVVSVESVKVHPLYRKRIRRHRKYHVHADDARLYPVGSSVTFEECRPMSRTKRWRVVESSKL
jgi:small subunit ribosomal protein S17